MNNQKIYIILCIILFLHITQSFSQDSVYCKGTKFFYNIDDALKNPAKVKCIGINDYDFNLFFQNIKKFDSLVFLMISLDSLTYIPDKIKELKNLEYLMLSIVRFDNSFTSLHELKNLRKIHLTIYKGKSIPKSFLELKNLEILYIDAPNIKNIEINFEGLNSLKALNIYAYKLKNINFFNTQYAKLKRLSLTGVKIKHLPSEITTIASLQSLECFYLRKLNSKIFNDIPHGELSNLKHIGMSFCNLKNIPFELLNLNKNITLLNLTGNDIELIPQDLIEFNNIDSLILRRSKIKFIQEGIFNHLPNLRVIHLEENQLKSIPVNDFKHIDEVHLYYNDFDEKYKEELRTILKDSKIYFTPPDIILHR